MQTAAVTAIPAFFSEFYIRSDGCVLEDKQGEPDRDSFLNLRIRFESKSDLE